jgi:SagB-type dehydrogenase family enzyme
MEPTPPRLYNYICKIQADLAQSSESSLASLYHEQSKRWPSGRANPPVLFDRQRLPEFSRSAFKEYRLAGRVALPEPQPLSVALDRAILARRTMRSFAGLALNLGQVGTLLGLSYRIMDAAALGVRSNEIPRRPVPSGGALYPLELYLAAMNVEGLPAGLYHYHPARHALEVLAQTSPEPALSRSFLPASLPPGAGLVLCICGVLPRNRFKYEEFGYRLMLLEAGHLAQNVLLVVQALGLGGMPCGGFYDDRMHDYLGVDGVDEVCLYLLVIGHPARPAGDDPPIEPQ